LFDVKFTTNPGFKIVGKEKISGEAVDVGEDAPFICPITSNEIGRTRYSMIGIFRCN
jgi:hypothetical protein